MLFTRVVRSNMRLWHKDLIPVLPRQQLVSQWRECCCIARNIAVNGTPNHLLVNKIMDYNISHFIRYTTLVVEELLKRGYNVETSKFTKWIDWSKVEAMGSDELFADWHNDRYLIQCYHNLQEKYDCGGITEHEWHDIVTYWHYRIQKRLMELKEIRV